MKEWPGNPINLAHLWAEGKRLLRIGQNPAQLPHVDLSKPPNARVPEAEILPQGEKSK